MSKQTLKPPPAVAILLLAGTVAEMNLDAGVADCLCSDIVKHGIRQF